MEILSSIGIGIVILIVGTGIIYIFKVRQLYLVIPRLFEYSSLSKNGKTIEVIIFNKSRKVEDEIKIELPKAGRYELLASSSTNVKIIDPYIIIEKVLPKENVSIVLLYESENVEKFDIVSFHSKEAKGKIIKSLGNVPENFGDLFLGVLAIGVAVALFVLSFTYVPKLYKNYKVSNLSQTTQQHWDGLDKYVSTELSGCYTNQEFPIQLLSKEQKLDSLILNFRVINKAASPLKIYATYDGFMFGKRRSNVDSWDIKPNSNLDFKLECYCPPGTEKNYKLEFSIVFGDEYISEIFYKIK